jgi:hypothetical protein
LLTFDSGACANPVADVAAAAVRVPLTVHARCGDG